jgi:hypothetical protein
MKTFSQRQGLDLPDAEITVRHDAPPWLRDLVVDYAYESGWKPGSLRTILFRELMETPNPGNWSDFPNIDFEVRELLQKAPWFFVYDLIERLCKRPDPEFRGWNPSPQGPYEFPDKVNRAFRKKGVGWQLMDGQIQVRGPEVFEHALSTAADLAAKSGREVARAELHEALRDISRLPDPDVTGAIRHAMAALECVGRDITSEPSLTLGNWLKRNQDAFPAPLNLAVDKLWAYASEYGRHVREGRTVSFEEAELVVGVSASLTVYLLRKT